MNILAGLIPGFRDVRAPLVSGVAWALAILVVFRDKLAGAPGEVADSFPASVDLPYVEGLRTAAVVLVLYFLGTMTVSASTAGIQLVLMRRLRSYKASLSDGSLANPLWITQDLWACVFESRPHAADGTPKRRLQVRLHRWLMPVTDVAMNRIAERVRRVVSRSPVGVVQMIGLDDRVTANVLAWNQQEQGIRHNFPHRWVEIAVIEEIVRGEPEQQLLTEPTYVGLFERWDRQEAEAELRAGLLIPGAILLTALLLRTQSAWVAVGGFVLGAVFLTALAGQAATHLRSANSLVGIAVGSRILSTATISDVEREFEPPELTAD